MFVAVYQRALKLLYVDELLERLKAEFAEQVRAGLGRPTRRVRACVRESQCWTHKDSSLALGGKI